MLVLSSKKDNFLTNDTDTVLATVKNSLFVLVVVFAIAYTSMSYVYGIKFILTVLVAYFFAREVEMLFLTHQRPMNREKAKLYIDDSKPEISGLLLALLLPVNTPLFVTLIGIAFGTFVVRMAFGGFSFNIFNVAIASRVFIQVSWSDLLASKEPTGLIDYLLSLVTKVDYSNVNDILFNKLNFEHFSLTGFSLPSLLVTIVIAGVFIYLAISKVIRPTNTILALVLFFITFKMLNLDAFALCYTISPLVLLITIFSLNDPITTPNSLLGNLVSITIFVGITAFMLLTKSNEYAILFALLFVNMLTPLLDNKVTEKSKKYKVLIFCIIFLTGTIFLLNSEKPDTADGAIPTTEEKANPDSNSSASPNARNTSGVKYYEQ